MDAFFKLPSTKSTLDPEILFWPPWGDDNDTESVGDRRLRAILLRLSELAERAGRQIEHAVVPEGATTFMTWQRIAKALGCSRSTAYRHLRNAVGGQRNRTPTVDEWNRYAQHTLRLQGDQPWADLEKTYDSGSASGSTTRPSPSTAATSSARPAREAKWRPGQSSTSGSRKPAIKIVVPRAMQRSDKPSKS